ILVWSPLAGGLLSGKFRRGEAGPEGSRHFQRAHREPPIHDEDALSAIVDTLVSVAEARRASAATVALAWLLGRPGVSSIITRAATTERWQRRPAAGQTQHPPDGDCGRGADPPPPPLLYPYWHQAWTAKDRLSAADLTLLGPHIT